MSVRRLRVPAFALLLLLSICLVGYLVASYAVYDTLAAVPGTCHREDAQDTPEHFSAKGLDDQVTAQSEVLQGPRDNLEVAARKPDDKPKEANPDDNKLLLMDKKTFKIGGNYDKIEVCDVLTEDRELICVKKMENSSSMSHLFSQGSVSATLLRRGGSGLTGLTDRVAAHGGTLTIDSDKGRGTTLVAEFPCAS